MLRVAHVAIQQVERLRQSAELERSLLEARGSLTPAEHEALRELEKLDLELAQRIAWLEALLCEEG